MEAGVVNYPDDKTFFKRNISVFYLIEFFSSLYFIIPIWVAFELRFMSLSQLALVEIVIFGSQLILELPTGALADLLGKKPTVFLGLIGTGIGFIMFALANSFPDFLISGFLFGLGGSLFSGAREALLFDTLKQVGKEKTFDKVLSKLGVIFQLGMAGATLAGGFLYLIDIRLPGIAGGIAMFIAAICILFLFEPKIDTEKFTLLNYIKQTKIGFMELFKTKYSSLISIFYGLVGGVTFSVQIVFTKLILTELNFSSDQMGTIFSSIGVVVGILLFLLIGKTKILTRKRSLFLFAVLIPLVLLPGILFNKTIILPFIFLIVLLSSARWVLLGKYTNEIFTSKNRATAISALSMFVGIIYVLVMAISGPVMEKFGGSKMFFTVLGIFSLLTITPLGIYISKMDVGKKQLKTADATTLVLPETPAI